jgi:hypothetical protein
VTFINLTSDPKHLLVTWCERTDTRIEWGRVTLFVAGSSEYQRHLKTCAETSLNSDHPSMNFLWPVLTALLIPTCSGFSVTTNIYRDMGLQPALQKHVLKPVSFRPYGVLNRLDMARVQPADETADESITSSGGGEGVNIPFDGIVGKENGALFDKPLNIYDPLKDTSGLPGEDGSPEKIAAIQQRIEERVAALKKSGEWGDDGEVYGSDPLAKQSLVQTMTMQLKACKPFETVDELLLTYALVLVTTFTLSLYLIFLRDNFDAAADWYIKTDFDVDFLPSVFGSN